MSNCFWGHRNIFIFDPKCKLSDTPDCDWHVSRTHAKNLHAIAVLYKNSRTPSEYKIKDTIFSLNVS